MDLFEHSHLTLPGTPLAQRIRPREPLGILGQTEAQSVYQRAQKQGRLQSLILWGPPGTGKTSFALAITSALGLKTVSVNAIEIGSKALRELGNEAKDRRLQWQQQTVLFLDEIHRLNKGQQDVLLPFVESGEFILIGATTENPSYELNRALLSRCQLVVFKALEEKDIQKILEMACQQLDLVLSALLEPEALTVLTQFADGDARKALGALELLISEAGEVGSRPALKAAEVSQLLGKKVLAYDKTGDSRFDTISAFIKSIRGSDADAGLYYLARMLESGEDPLYVARRLVVLASEDVGNADPRALSVAVAGAQAVELVGLPEAAINLAQVVTYLASAPKSNRSYVAFKKAQELVQTTGLLEIPKALRSAKTASMKALGYGEGYRYPFEAPKHYIEQNYLPEKLGKVELYQPSERGFEKQIAEFLKWLKS